MRTCLVVLADQEDAALGAGEEDGQVELAPVDVLHLVEKEVRATLPPAAQQRGVVLEQLERPADQVVEVESTADR